MKNRICFLIWFSLATAAAYGQDSSIALSQLRAHKSYDVNNSHELEVSFEINEPEKVTNLKITLANNAEKDINESIELSNGDWHVWTRNELNVIVFRITIPESLGDDCKHFEVYAVDNQDNKSNILESPVY